MADEIVSGLIQVEQEEVTLLLEAGYLLMEMNKFSEAEDVFVGVAALVPHNEVPLICLGNLFTSLGKLDRALKFHQDAAKKNPESALAKAHIGEVFALQNKKKKAKQILEEAVEMDPEGHAGAFASSLLDGLAAEVL